MNNLDNIVINDGIIEMSVMNNSIINDGIISNPILTLRSDTIITIDNDTFSVGDLKDLLIMVKSLRRQNSELFI